MHMFAVTKPLPSFGCYHSECHLACLDYTSVLSESNKMRVLLPWLVRVPHVWVVDVFSLCQPKLGR